MKSQQVVLNDVMIMRPIVIFLLIVTHSFTMYTGGSWALPDGIHKVWAYNEITHIAFSFMLETFVFISGYLFGMQQKKQISFKVFLKKKLQRLIVPSIMFSIVYIACFNCEEFQSGGVILSILNGAGHLWFLPMLFWCFVMTYFLSKIKTNDKIKIALCFILALLSGLLPLPLRLDKACYYILFFYFGVYLYPRRTKIIDYISIQKTILLIIIFVVSYVAFSYGKQTLSECEMITISSKLLRVLGMKLCTIIYSSTGLVMLFVVSNYALKNKDEWQCPLWLVSINRLCFGIYIYQQFILKFLYYSTSLPQLMGIYWLPWVGLAITMIISIIFAKLTVQTKMGRVLIG